MCIRSMGSPIAHLCTLHIQLIASLVLVHVCMSQCDWLRLLNIFSIAHHRMINAFEIVLQFYLLSMLLFILAISIQCECVARDQRA